MNVQVEAPPPGSSLYYSLLYCDEKTREKISALRNLYQAIREIPFKCQDAKLAQIKFQWWREEIHRLKHKTAQHPIAQTLQKYVFFHEKYYTGNLNIILDAFE
jgi:15-cis-phytoene synthase